MKAVIPYKLDKDSGNELRYAIRSLIKHFKPLSDIILVGDRPDWYKGEYIFCNDIPERKEFSIYTKLMQVQKTVLYTNDDFFALQDFDEMLPNYYDYLCGDKKPVDRVYKDLYAACPAQWMNFDIHTPLIIDTTRFTWNIDRPIKTYYANQNKLPGTVLADLKLSGEYSAGEIFERIKGRPFFSTKENSKLGGMPVVLQLLYPEPSIYERT